MRISIYILALAPFALIGCAEEEPTTTTTREVTTTGPVAREVLVTRTPPEVLVEAETISPGPGYVWTRGYWRWNGADYVWVPGAWGGSSAQGQRRCGSQATGFAGRVAGSGSRATGGKLKWLVIGDR